MDGYRTRLRLSSRSGSAGGGQGSFLPSLNLCTPRTLATFIAVSSMQAVPCGCFLRRERERRRRTRDCAPSYVRTCMMCCITHLFRPLAILCSSLCRCIGTYPVRIRMVSPAFLLLSLHSSSGCAGTRAMQVLSCMCCVRMHICSLFIMANGRNGRVQFS